MTKIYITRYALTEGIVERDAKVDESKNMATFIENGYTRYFHREDFYLSFDEAYNRVMDMKDRKIKSIKKQLSKLRELSF